MEIVPQKPDWLARHMQFLKVILILITVLVLVFWWLYTPPGALGKADAAGYAVCHRIEARSFFIGDRQTPLCARCSGMYLGALLGIIYLQQFGRRAGLPSIKISVVLVLFLVAFGLDGANSYLHLFPLAPGLYEPQNWMRLLTGTGVGIGIAAVLVPVVHQVLWTSYDPNPSLARWRDFLPLIGMAGVLDFALLTGNPLLLYPLAILSGVSVFLVLTLVYMVIWIMITKRENRISDNRFVWMPLLAGFLFALIQVGALDAVRFWITGTWNGFQF